MFKIILRACIHHLLKIGVEEIANEPVQKMMTGNKGKETFNEKINRLGVRVKNS